MELHLRVVTATYGARVNCHTGYTALPSIRHKTDPALITARKAVLDLSTRWMEGCVC